MTQILRSFGDESRTFLWESRAFGALRVPTSWHAPVRNIMTLYKYAGKEMRYAVEEDHYGDTGQAQIDINYSEKTVDDAGNIVRALGVSGCGGE